MIVSLRYLARKTTKKRVDIREWKNDWYATKKGISLNQNLLKTFSLALDMIDTALSKKEELNYHIGSNVFCTIQQGNPCVNIRQYWRPPGNETLVPTKRGLCLRPVEYRALKFHIAEIEKVIPKLQSLVPCFCVMIIWTNKACFNVLPVIRWNIWTGERETVRARRHF